MIRSSVKHDSKMSNGFSSINSSMNENNLAKSVSKPQSILKNHSHNKLFSY